MTFPFGHAPSLIQQERELCLFSRGCAARLPPQRGGSSQRKRLCFGSASPAQQSSSCLAQPHARCTARGRSIGRRGPSRPSRSPRAPAPSPEPAAAVPSRSPGGGGHHGVSNGCCITLPDASSAFSPQKKNKAVLKTTLSVEQLTKNKKYKQNLMEREASYDKENSRSNSDLCLQR